MQEPTLIETLNVNNSLGECILWHVETQCLWWTDVESSRLYRFQPENRVLDNWSTPERLCSFGFIANDDRIITAFERGLAFFRPENGEVEWIARPEEDHPNIRFNDGRVDREGRFWSGGMAENFAELHAHSDELASLYCLKNNICTKHETGIRISNSICWNPDGTAMFFADSLNRQIDVYDFNNGRLSNRRCFARTPQGVIPDGSIVDCEGYLWNAQWGGSQVVRYSPDGVIDLILKVPVSQPTCIAFGGPDLNWLCVTSANVNLGPEELTQQPQAGNVFIYDTPYTGLPESKFNINE